MAGLNTPSAHRQERILYNARAIVQDMEEPAVGTDVFDRFTGARDGTLGNYQSLAEVFSAHQSPGACVVDETIARMHELAGVGERRPLEA